MLSYILSGYMVAPSTRYGVSAAEARSTVESATIPLQHRIESLELACAAMWELLKETSNLGDQALVDKIREIDLRDGKLDGKAKKEIPSCPACHRQALTKQGRRCVWCGAEMGAGPF